MTNIKLMKEYKTEEKLGKSILFIWNINSNVLESSILFLNYRNPGIVICMPSQIGCTCGCKFCGLANSTSAKPLDCTFMMDIISYSINKAREIDNKSKIQISFMGQGEPFLNFDNVIKIIDNPQVNEHVDVFGISTVGIVDGLKKIQKYPQLLNKIKLQISLHSTKQSCRELIIPFSKNNKIENILNEAEKISCISQNDICLNYILFRDLNDTDEDLENLILLCKNKPFYIKLSNYNNVNNNLIGSQETKYQFFYNTLTQNGIKTKLFSSVGQNIGSGCGQLGLYKSLNDNSSTSSKVFSSCA